MALTKVSRLRRIRQGLVMRFLSLYTLLGVLQAHGIGVKRSGASSVKMAVEIIILTLIFGISGFFVATTIPPALTIIATAALVSVSGAIVTLFQTVLSISLVGVIIILYVAVIYHVVTSVA